ncbi:MAG: heavy metal translocating P-type ATPase [Bacteroidota bacterium]
MPLSSETGIEAGLRKDAGRSSFIALVRQENFTFTIITGFFIMLSLIPPVKGSFGFDPSLIGAVIGAYPMLKYAGIGLFVRKDLTAGVLVSVALVAAMAIGEYFAAAEVAFIMLLGELLENATVAKAGKAVEKLVALVPTTAHVRVDGEEMEVPVSQLLPGRVVLVRAGELVPADGKVLSGAGSVDQSALTGEPMPSEKRPGDEVWAGTINEAGYLEIEVSKGARDTTIAQIGRLMTEAQAKRAPIQRLADRWAKILVPVSMGTALLTWIITGQVVRAVTILVVFCPCALVLATPTAVVAAIGRAAKRGILIKSGAALEAAGHVNALALDKTGTLTEGQPAVVSVTGFDMAEEEVLRLAAAVERCSNHPLAKAIVRAYNGTAISPACEFEDRPGEGVSATIGADRITVGKAAFLAERGIVLTAVQHRQIEAARHPGQTIVLVARGMDCIGALFIGDAIRPDSRRTMESLRGMGARLVMMTGDSVDTAREVAAACGVEEVYAGLMPAQKAEIVASLQAKGYRVAMVGDGINDAPALATASLGMAMGTGAAAIAAEAGDVTILSDDMTKVAETITLGRRTIRIIRQNLAASAVINLAAVAAAALGIIGPVVGALVHNAGSILVVINAARSIGRTRGQESS